jgi:uncharacterized membrane protein YozB (DUF420 family)
MPFAVEVRPSPGDFDSLHRQGLSMIFAVKLSMTLATLFLVAGYRVASSDNQLHRKLMILGLASFVGTAVVLVLGANVFDGTYAAAAWSVRLFGEKGAQSLLLAHRGLAAISALLLVYQAWTGWKRRPVHLRMARLTLVLWIVSYISGCVLFV